MFFCSSMFFFLNSDLETFIQDYIDQKNKEVSEYNAEVRRSADQYLDLFAWEGSARPQFLDVFAWKDCPAVPRLSESVIGNARSVPVLILIHAFVVYLRFDWYCWHWLQWEGREVCSCMYVRLHGIAEYYKFMIVAIHSMHCIG